MDLEVLGYLDILAHTHYLGGDSHDPDDVKDAIVHAFKDTDHLTDEQLNTVYDEFCAAEHKYAKKYIKGH